MTNGELPCSRCDSGHPKSEVGYVPLYRGDDGRAVFVLLYSEQREPVGKLRLFDRVIVARKKSKREATFISIALNQEPRWVSSDPRKMVPADLTEALLNVWNLPDLTRWYRLNEARVNSAALEEVKARGTSPAGTPERVLQVNQQFIDAVRKAPKQPPPETSPSAALLSEVLPIVLNGKHR